MPWDPDFPQRRPSMAEVALTLAALTLFLAGVVWFVWTFEVWMNGMLTLYDVGMPAVLVVLVLVSARVTRRQRRVISQARGVDTEPAAAVTDRRRIQLTRHRTVEVSNAEMRRFEFAFALLTAAMVLWWGTRGSVTGILAGVALAVAVILLLWPRLTIALKRVRS